MHHHIYRNDNQRCIATCKGSQLHFPVYKFLQMQLTNSYWTIFAALFQGHLREP